jgi:hypothetical protein|tara:strand:+ start:1331 stop:1450 length:120 start_codon:yes stop_codon:yes gene_type:complete
MFEKERIPLHFFEVYKNFTPQKTNDQNVTALKVKLIYEI